jgi:hypothetical protein
MSIFCQCITPDTPNKLCRDKLRVRRFKAGTHKVKLKALTLNFMRVMLLLCLESIKKAAKRSVSTSREEEADGTSTEVTENVLL